MSRTTLFDKCVSVYVDKKIGLSFESGWKESKVKNYLIILFCVLSHWLLTSCDKAEVSNKPVTIAFNPWPGYEFLYLAEKKGFFEKTGANIELVQMGSLSDSQRSYINGHTDGLASTIIEAVQAEALGGKPLKIVMVPDYSNGGDVIVAPKNITKIEELKGKKIGCEVSSLGIFVLQRALAKAGLALSDVRVVNVEQSYGEESILDGKIDAFVSYPPVSVDILKNDQYHTIFTSAEIPREIIDTVALSEDVLSKNPGITDKLLEAWQLALDYYRDNPEDAVKIMADREGISPEDFTAVLGDLMIMDAKQQQSLFSKNHDELTMAVNNVCQTLVHVEAIQDNCQSLSDIIYRGNP